MKIKMSHSCSKARYLQEWSYNYQASKVFEMMGRIADKTLAQAGKRAHVWARAHMTIFDYILKSACTEQAVIGNKSLPSAYTLQKKHQCLSDAPRNLGAQIAICSANPLSTQDAYCCLSFFSENFDLCLAR